MVRADEFSDALASMSKSEYEISRDEYFANAENLVKGSLKVDRKTVLAERESFYYALINKAKDVGGTNIGIEFKMYKNILADYTGEYAGLGELYSLELEQRKEAQIREWDRKESEFYANKQEWVENMQFLQRTGEAKFKTMETTFLNSVNEWRENFKKEVQARILPLLTPFA